MKTSASCSQGVGGEQTSRRWQKYPIFWVTLKWFWWYMFHSATYQIFRNKKKTVFFNLTLHYWGHFLWPMFFMVGQAHGIIYVCIFLMIYSLLLIDIISPWHRFMHSTWMTCTMQHTVVVQKIRKELSNWCAQARETKCYTVVVKPSNHFCWMCLSWGFVNFVLSLGIQWSNHRTSDDDWRVWYQLLSKLFSI